MRDFRFMRWVIGEIKPLVVDSIPPGGIGNIIFVALVAVALWFSLPMAGDGLQPRLEVIATRGPDQVPPAVSGRKPVRLGQNSQ